MDRQKILVADDEPGVRLTLRRMLEKDYVVLEAVNGEEAVDIAQREKPSIILMDLMMPGMDGYTACSKIRANPATRAIPVVILTAVGHELNKRFAQELGANGYITKPFQIQELKETINKLLETPA
jgi:CheY-like chemotaxis protein